MRPSITALIHSSSATIGIVMGLGASGVLGWETAVAFSLGADLGTTITSWMASLNLSKNAKRAAYAHMSFNFIGVAVMLILFFPALELLKYAHELVRRRSRAFRSWSTARRPSRSCRSRSACSRPRSISSIRSCSFPFIGVFERVLSRIGRTAAEDIEDYSVPKYLDRELVGDLKVSSVPAVQQETQRHLKAGALFLDIARGVKTAPSDPGEHYAATDILSRDIRAFSASLFKDEHAL